MLKKLNLYLYTIRRMKLSMIAFRLKPQKKLTSEQLSMKRPLDRNKTIVMAETDLAADYLSRFDVESLLKGDLFLLNEWHKFNFETWSVPEASHLWNFNLHYFEYCIPLAAKWAETKEERYWNYFKFLIQSWMDSCKYPRGDAWHPYTISLRLINWLVSRELFADALETDNVFDSAMQESMYAQYRHLLANQEKHLLANHYFENLKTLLIMSRLFNEEDVYTGIFKDFCNQLNEQILPDGVHFERSLMYHKLILEGLMRVSLIEKQYGGANQLLIEKMQNMLNAMCSLEKGMGKTPFFNDAADGIAKTGEQLRCVCAREFELIADETICDFPDAGYYKMYSPNKRAAVMVDAGMPGPSYVLGHAHCDALSYELSVDEKPVVVNCGTYAYQTPLRSYYRSTKAHNTFQIAGKEQMECWGEHRVAKCYKGVFAMREGACSFAANLVDGAVKLEREIVLTNSQLFIVDKAKNEPIASYVHVLNERDARRVFSKEATRTSKCFYSGEFGKKEEAVLVQLEGHSQIAYSIDFGDGLIG